MEQHPDALEASYARAQTLNTVTSIVPRVKVFAAYLRLIASELEGRQSPDSNT